MRHGRYRSGKVSIDVDIDELLDQVSDEALHDELESRGAYSAESDNLVAEAYRWLVRGNRDEAMLCLERHMGPRWKSVAEARLAYQSARTEAASHH